VSPDVVVNMRREAQAIALSRPDSILSFVDAMAAHPSVRAKRMTDDEAVSLAAGRVRRGNVEGALALLVHQGKVTTVPVAQFVNCPVCGGAGEIVECANDGRCGCSHTYDKTWKCTACCGNGEVTPDVAAALVAESDVEA
jgi:hypothetical protein